MPWWHCEIGKVNVLWWHHVIGKYNVPWWHQLKKYFVWNNMESNFGGDKLGSMRYFRISLNNFTDLFNWAAGSHSNLGNYNCNKMYERCLFFLLKDTVMAAEINIFFCMTLHFVSMIFRFQNDLGPISLLNDIPVYSTYNIF